jgi:hypothetical protein
MAQGQSIVGPDFGKRVIRVALGVVGLLVLRAILGALPMLKNASAIGNTFLTPLVVANAVVDSVIFFLILSFGLGLGRTIQANYTRLPDLGRMISLATVALVLLFAYGSYQTVVACLVESPEDTLKALTVSQKVTGENVGEVIQSFVNAFQGLAKDAMEQNIKTLAGNALAGYQAAAVLALRQPPDAYGWTFLILIAIPVIGIVVLVSRNLDTITDMVFHAAAATARPAGGGYGPSVPPPGVGPAGEAAAPGDVIEKLAKLKALLDAGVISREEFDGQKTAILGGSPATPEPEELRGLRSLFEAGALTEEEYEAQKRRILAKL